MLYAQVMASKKKTAAATKTRTRSSSHPGCHGHHGRKAECPRTGEQGKECARIGPDGNACGAVSQADAQFCHHCNQPF